MKVNRFYICLGLAAWHGLSAAGELPFPVRPPEARGGQAIARSVAGLDLAQRETVLLREILSGNVPAFLRRPVEVTLTEGGDTLIFFTTPDYLAVGSQDDAFQTPLTPGTASAIADRLDSTLPTPKMVDAIFRAAPLKLIPHPRPPGPDMTTVPAFLEYQAMVQEARQAALAGYPWGTLTVGHHKDIVRTPLLADLSGKVAIYGWHRPAGTVIQPLYTGHTASWVDYSHGVRLVQRAVVLNGRPSTVDRILADPKTAHLLNDEPLPSAAAAAVAAPDPEAKKEAARGSVFHEILTTLEPEAGVRLVVNRPAHPDPTRPVQVIVYALPNGNSIEQTMGHLAAPGEDPRFGAQQIAAQTRWLRAHQPELTRIVAYVECAEKSWPAWGRKHPDSEGRIARIMDRLREHLAVPDARLVLTGHSGGGSFIFRYLNSQERIPDDVERIAFLDSNYGWDAAHGHPAKLTAWLQGGPARFLTVIAYHDSIALLNGKTFVSEAGGTWGRSHAMLRDFGASFRFTQTTEGQLQQYAAMAGRVTFWLMENPDKAVLHTLLVERNGYLHSLLTGTPAVGQGYQFFGAPAYRSFVADE